MKANYTQLKGPTRPNEDDTWGIRIDSIGIQPNQNVTVTKKDGTQKMETVGRVLWTGNGVSLCSIVKSSSPNASRSSGGGRVGRGTRTGCSCGSVEEYTKDSDCRSCKYDAE